MANTQTYDRKDGGHWLPLNEALNGLFASVTIEPMPFDVIESDPFTVQKTASSAAPKQAKTAATPATSPQSDPLEEQLTAVLRQLDSVEQNTPEYLEAKKELNHLLFGV